MKINGTRSADIIDYIKFVVDILLLCINPSEHVDNRDMVTYCLGSARQKRAYFEKMSNATVLDNVEVLFCASENGRNYFAYGEPPFSAFTVEQYLKYKLALDGVDRIDNALELISKLCISRRARIGALSSAELRCVDYCVRACGDKSDRTIVINLDGARCSRKNRKALERLLSVCCDAYVCVCDERFLKHAESPFKTLDFGKRTKRRRPKFYAAKRLAKQLDAYKIAVM